MQKKKIIEDIFFQSKFRSRWVACINPPDPPPEANLVSNYDGVKTKEELKE